MFCTRIRLARKNLTLNLAPVKKARLSIKRPNYHSFTRRLTDHRHPSSAPKAFLNQKHIRQHVDLYSKNCEDRHYKDHASYPQQIAESAEELRRLGQEKASLLKKIRPIEKTLAKAAASSGNQSNEKISAARNEASRLAEALKEIELGLQSHENRAARLAQSLPNLTSPETPLNGEPKVLSYFNYDPDQPPQPSSTRSHVDIGTALSIIDFTSANTTSGWGFYYLVGDGALLEQALIAHTLNLAQQHGWTPISPPSLVYSHIAEACGFQPRDAHDEQQTWHIAQPEPLSTKPRRSLSATAEIPLAALHANQTLDPNQLPLKYVGHSRCYRAEAGARGVGAKGLYRVHEFSKVELFAWTGSDDAPSKPSDPTNTTTTNTQTTPPTRSTTPSSFLPSTAYSLPLFQSMLSLQTAILSSLNLPLRVLEMPSSDLGASAYRKIDIETLFPSRAARDGGWGELSSLSLCTDYQSRRLGTHVAGQSGAKKRFAHTLNGTAMAVPRVLAAVLEAGWREVEGVVVVPEVLRGYLGGREVIGPRGKK